MVAARLKSRLVPGSGLRKATLAVTHAQHWLAAAKQLQASMTVACFFVSVGYIMLGIYSCHVEVFFSGSLSGS